MTYMILIANNTVKLSKRDKAGNNTYGYLSPRIICYQKIGIYLRHVAVSN